MKLLVSIHDVAPPNEERVRRLWQMMRARSVTPSLFVVPNWHGGSPLHGAPAFAAWLRECAAEGSTIILHGERHDEVGRHRTLTDHARAFGRTDREGEFLGLTTEEARVRIFRGREVLRDAGLDPVGFVAPAWLSRRSLLAELSRFGFLYSEDVRFVHLLRRGASVDAPVTRWSTRTPARATISVHVAAVRRRISRSAPVVRIALHPADLTSSRVAQSIDATIDGWMKTHAPSCYDTL